MKESAAKLIVIGGSWGGIQASLRILQGLPADYSIPVVLVLHRLRNFEGSLQDVFGRKLAMPVVEVEDKEPIKPGHVYVAPSNYHVLIEQEYSFSLDVSELENYSRPSIDVTFTSAADVFGSRLTAILLSGASKDGSAGLKYLAGRAGTALVQDPQEAEVATMPLAGIAAVPTCQVLNTTSIHNYLLSLHDR